MSRFRALFGRNSVIMSDETPALKKAGPRKIRSRNARAGEAAKTGTAVSVIVLHAYPVTLVLSCAASRRLRFED